MRVLFWSETFWPRVGGVENLAAELLPALQSRGCQFAVVTWENNTVPDILRFRGTPVYRLPFFFREGSDGVASLLEMRARIARIKREFAPDLIHINSYGSSVLFHVNTCHAHPAPTVLTLHQALPNHPLAQDTLLAHLLRTAQWVTACSASVLTSARDAMPEIAARSSVIYNGLDIPRIAPKPLSMDPPRLLCIGRLVQEKGFDLALAAFASVRARFPMASLVIAGEGAEGEKLRRQAIDLGFGGAVRFAGLLPQGAIPELINDASIVLIPSRLEGFGLVALEAAFMARPVVAARVGGLPEIVLHGETGLLAAAQNPNELTAALEFLLSRPEEAARMGRAARVRAEKHFGWDRCVEGYDSLYRTLLAGAQPDTRKPSAGASAAD
jgi:glycogen(starch) synthase